jgi:hypothetical protein
MKSYYALKHQFRKVFKIEKKIGSVFGVNKSSIYYDLEEFGREIPLTPPPAVTMQNEGTTGKTLWEKS